MKCTCVSVNNQIVQKTNLKNGFVNKMSVLTDIKQIRGYYLPICIIRKTIIKFLISFKQFMMMLFYMLHFCIPVQTENMVTSFLAVEMEKKKQCVRKIIYDCVEASTRKSQARFQIIQVKCSTEHRIRLK